MGLLIAIMLAMAGSSAPVAEISSPQYFAVLVADAETSAAWYEATFGLERLDHAKAEDGAWEIVNLGNRELVVELIRDNRAQEAQRPRGFFKVGFAVPDVEAVAGRLAAGGAEPPRIVDDAAHGVRILQLKDPDGNTIQLTSPLEAK